MGNTGSRGTSEMTPEEAISQILWEILQANVLFLSTNKQRWSGAKIDENRLESHVNQMHSVDFEC